MDDLTARVATARKTYNRFAGFSRTAGASVDNRDLAIFWFVLAFEAIWKAAKAFVDKEGAAVCSNPAHREASFANRRSSVC
jgi:hypothetical protein